MKDESCNEGRNNDINKSTDAQKDSVDNETLEQPTFPLQQGLPSTTVVPKTAVEQPQDVMSYRQHMKGVFQLTYPIILGEVFQNTLPIMDIAFVGQLGKDELAATALATVWFNLWHSAMTGFMTAIDTLLSQSYGAQQYDQFSIWTGNSIIVVFLVTILVSGIIALCGPAMHLFGQDPALADAAGEFSYRLLPGLFPYYIFKVLTKYLQTQNKLAPGVWIGVLANGMNALFNWALIYAADLGLQGAPWATTLTRTVEFLMIIAYLYHQRRHRPATLQDTWPRFDKNKFTRATLKPFWKLAISGALSITAEAWSFEITTILAGLLSILALDAHIVSLSVATFLFLSFPFAIGIAASIRVGQLIGEQRPKDAQKSTHASVFLSTIVQAILCIILLLCKDVVGYVFSGEDEVVHLVSKLVPISCLFMMGDAIQATIGGVFRGLGRQTFVLMLNILGFWVCAVPLGALLTFVADIGVFGLWWGFNIGIYTSAAVGIVFLKLRVDWKLEAKKALQRLSIDSETNSNNGTPMEDTVLDDTERREATTAQMAPNRCNPNHLAYFSSFDQAQKCYGIQIAGEMNETMAGLSLPSEELAGT
eukprot:scaffold10576_cov84-Cylindrotheca_fusiformis.AAC.2